MNNAESKNVKFAVAILALLLLSSVAVLSNLEINSASAQDDDLLQYDWPMGGRDEGQSGFNPGPGPNRPNVLWKVSTSGSGFVSVFDGKAFVLSGSTLKAYDAFNGASKWTASLKHSAHGTGGTYKIDDTYLFVDYGSPASFAIIGIEVRKIANGDFVSNITFTDSARHPGGGNYLPGAYSSELKMKYLTAYSDATSEGQIVAISLADPTNPVIAWTYIVDESSEILAFGDGKLFVGSYQAAVYALNGTDGTFLWRAHKTGIAGQTGFYYNGNLYHAATSQFMSCYDGDTGEVMWEYDSRVLGTRVFYAYRGAGGYGRVYDCAIASAPNGWVVCWDAETGELLWKQPAYYNIAYTTVAVADGKIYTSICDQGAGSVTAGLTMPGYALACFDAFTGAQLWRIDGLNVAYPVVAYGNVYAVTGNYLYCIGDSKPATSWAFGFAGNVEQPRVAVGQSGPDDISIPKWVFETGGEVSGSPAVVDGKVYIGSHDNNWYCLDAYTGEKIWNFETGYRVMSSAAVYDGKVYTGADDGYIYCIDAQTGDEVWKVPAGGLITNILFPQEWQPRSSPIIVGSKLYVGSLDGKVYCLRTSDGQVLWTYETEGPIGGSPAYSDGVIYISSTDTYLYALDALTGTFKWKSIGLNDGQVYKHFQDRFCCYTPTVGDGMVFIGGGVTYASNTPIILFAFNATTGEMVWKVGLGGNSQPVYIPAYVKGILYISENMQVTARNATDGSLIWAQWIGYQILSSSLYVDDLSGPKLYVGSDVGSISCLSAKDGKPISVYQSAANIDSSPAVWEGKIYVGSIDRNVYCFDDSPTVDFSISAEADKGAEMWNNETINIEGRLISNPTQMVFDGNSSYVEVASDMHPGLPDATIKLSITKPDGTDESLVAITNSSGYFSFSYSPTDVGDWGWVVYYEGETKPGITYAGANGDWNAFSVTEPPTTDGENPPPEGIPMEFVYGAVAVIVIVLVAVGAYIFLKRKK